MNSFPLVLRIGTVSLLAAHLLAPVSASAAGKGVAYVTNQDAGVSVINLDSMEVEKEIDIQGKGPRGLGVTSDGKFLVTANKDDGNISVIDTETGKLIKHIEIGKNPEFVRVKGHMAFVSFEPSSKGGPPPKPGSPAAKEEEDDDDDEPARIAIVDLKKGKKVREVVGGPETEGVEFAPDGKKLIITNEADNTITVHDIASGKLLKTIKTKEYGDRPRGIKVAPNGKTYVATLEYGNKFLVLDSNFKVLRTVDTGAAPYGISFDREGKRIFVATSRAKALEVYDANSYSKIKDVPTGDRCWHFSFTPDDKEVLLACGKSNEVIVIDAEKLEPVKHISDSQMPWGVVTYPKSYGSLDKP